MTGTLVIGLLGAVGSGKSTVAGILRGLGASVHDADRSAHQALKEAGKEVAGLLGKEVLGPDGTPDRERIAKRVFSDPEALKGLESILHPRVRKGMETWLASERARKAPAAVLDVPLLLEAGMDALCDRLLFVEAPEAERQARLRENRGWADGEAARRQALQGDLEAKRLKADAIVENAGTLEGTRKQVESIWKRWIPEPKGGER